MSRPPTRTEHRPSIKHVPGAEECRLRRFTQIVDLRRDRREEQRTARRQHIVAAEEKEIADLQSNDAVSKAALLEKWLPRAQRLAAQAETATSGMRYFRAMLSRNPNDAISEVVEAGAIERAVFFLRQAPDQTSAVLRFECAWVLTNITSGDSAAAAKVVGSGFTQVAVTWICAMASKQLDMEWGLLENLAWSLGNLAGDSPSTASQVANEGGLEALFRLLETASLYDESGGDAQQASGRLQCREQAVWAFSNFSRHRTAALRSKAMLARVAPILARAMAHPNTRLDGAWLLAYITDHADDAGLLSINELCSEALGIAVQVLCAPGTGGDSASAEACHAPLLRCLGNLCSGPNIVAANLIRQGLANGLGALLRHVGPSGSLKRHRKDVYWTLSNLAAAGQFAESIHASRLFPLLVELTHAERQAEMQAELYYFWENLLLWTPKDDLARYFFASKQIEWNALLRPQWLESLGTSPARVVQRSLACMLASLRYAPDADSYALQLRSNQGALEQIDEFQLDDDEATRRSSIKILRILLPEE
jgi:hypothetical protein